VNARQRKYDEKHRNEKHERQQEYNNKHRDEVNKHQRLYDNEKKEERKYAAAAAATTNKTELSSRMEYDREAGCKSLSIH
jgi:hypothetical protein